MWFHRFCNVAFAFVVASAYAHAEQLSISFHDPDSPSVHDIQWNTAFASPEMVFGLENTLSTTDLIYAWQLGFEIDPESGATGSLQFNTATLPPSYLFDGRSDGLVPAFSGPAAAIPVIGDSDSLSTGVLAPLSGMNLLLVDFYALPGTSGLFDIKAVPDLFNGCNWYSGDFDARSYENVPFGGGSVILGTVNVTSVPEPSVVILFLSGSLAAGAAACRRRARCRRGR